MFPQCVLLHECGDFLGAHHDHLGKCGTLGLGAQDDGTQRVAVVALAPAKHPVLTFNDSSRVQGRPPGSARIRRIAIVAAALAALPSQGQAAGPPLDFAWTVVRVIDGDRLSVDASADMPAPLAALLVRADHARPYDGGARAGWCGTPEGAPPDGAAAVAVAAPPEDAPAAPCELDSGLDALLACYDRQRAAAPPAATGIKAEVERHVIEPCIEVAPGWGIAAPGIVQRYGAANLTHAAKIAAAPILAELSETMRPYLTQGESEFRCKAYDVFRDICLMGLRRQIAGGGA